MVDYIEGTNIPVSAIAGNIKGGADYWAQRLKGADTDINDVLFSMAYSTPFSGSTQSGGEYQGQGQGNPNVGALQSGMWRANTGPTWAEEAVKSPSGSTDIYRERDTSGALTGKVWQGSEYGQSSGGGGGGGTGTGTGTGADSENPIVVDDPVVEVPDVASLSDEMKLSKKIQELINTNNPLFKAATTKAMQRMAKRGIVNSSIAQGEVMNSIMAVALPIAQAEVKALTENLYFNKDWTNKQKMQANDAAYNKMLTSLQGQLNYTLQQFIEKSRFGLQKLLGQQQMSLEDKIQKGRMALQTLTGQQTMTLQTLLGEQNITLQNLMQDGKMALQHLSGQQRMDLQDKLGEQGIDLQTLIGEQQLTAQQREIAANAWAKYGDWVSRMAATEGADQDAWKNMLDLLTGAGGWPELFPS